MDRLVPRYRWRLPGQPYLGAEFLADGDRRGLSRRLLTILASRGHTDAAALASFLDEPRVGLHDPALLPDADAFAGRVGRAVAAAERVLVFGDFDADGLTGLAILVLALRRLGLDAEPYIPDRSAEGHGLSLAAIEHAVAAGRSLIVTVDCGTSSGIEIELAAARGVDVLVTDHHRVPPRLPAALAIVNPQRADSRYPEVGLSGSGVAFKLAQLLLSAAGDAGGAALDLADLAAVGTVADVAPVTGENRAIARLGLERLRSAPRPGLAALLEKANLAGTRIDLESLAFVVAPRLNAAGRVGDAAIAARLLLATDPAEAAALAAELETANATRRDLLSTALAEARIAAAADGEAPLTVVAGPWPIGVIGLVAGRLADERGRPAVVFSNSTDPWRGSARSAGGFDLAGAFGECEELFERYGGHAAAAGCHLPQARYDEFRQRMVALAARLTIIEPVLAIDVVVQPLDVDYRLLRELSLLEPTGTGNPLPLVGIDGLAVVRARPASGGHTQLVLRKGHEVLDGICFGRDDIVASVAEGQTLDVVARLTSRTFGGYESLQLEVRDLAPAGTLRRLAAQASSAPPVVALAS